MKKITINEIAKLANVSKGTVSKVLNNYPHISDEMRERVMKIVHETGFSVIMWRRCWHLHARI
ncbi:MAG: LacI family DNA-binding transcriptional regulator [Anaerolineae bacterium]|nr:LacI family DNA-binding transcriptional regulator [Anaerolineae bacterium]